MHRFEDADPVNRWKLYRRYVAAILSAHLNERANLDDALQEVGLIFALKHGDVRDPNLERRWLQTVAMNVARGFNRRMLRERLRSRTIAVIEAVSPAVPNSDELESFRARIAAALKLLSVRELEVFRLIFEGSGRSNVQVAHMLQIDAATVGVLKFRALLKLKEALRALNNE